MSIKHVIFRITPKISKLISRVKCVSCCTSMCRLRSAHWSDPGKRWHRTLQGHVFPVRTPDPRSKQILKEIVIGFFSTVQYSSVLGILSILFYYKMAFVDKFCSTECKPWFQPQYFWIICLRVNEMITNDADAVENIPTNCPI